MSDFDKKHYEKLGQDILALAKRKGATSAEVSVSVESGFSVSARLGQPETVEHNHDKGVAITVYFAQQSGTASTSDTSPEAFEVAVDKACNIARYTSSDPYAGLAEKSLMAFNTPELDLDHPWDISPEEGLKLAIECESLALNDKRITNSEGVSLSTHRSLQVYANSYDFVASYIDTQHSLNCVLIAQDKNEMHRDYDYTVAINPSKLNSIENISKEAQRRTISRLGARQLKTQSAPVIFSAEIAKSIIGNFVNAISGSNLYRKSSFLLDTLNKPVFADHINIQQRPHLPQGLGSAPFDSEGVKTLDLDFVKDGILKNYVLSSYSARKLKMQSTGNAGGVFNLLVSSKNTLSFDDMLQQIGTGLLVTELIGQGVNLVTGDYSRGAFGYWIENGEIQFPVNEITIAGNLKDMFLNIAAIGNDVDLRSRIRTGSILIKKMTIAGH